MDLEQHADGAHSRHSVLESTSSLKNQSLCGLLLYSRSHHGLPCAHALTAPNVRDNNMTTSVVLHARTAWLVNHGHGHTNTHSIHPE